MQPNPVPTPRSSDVNASLTTHRRIRRVVENADFAAFVRRIMHAHARRIAEGDVDALPSLVDLATELDNAIGSAVTGLRGFGYSWADIGSRLGVTRQAAQQRWGGESA